MRNRFIATLLVCSLVACQGDEADDTSPLNGRPVGHHDQIQLEPEAEARRYAASMLTLRDLANAIFPYARRPTDTYTLNGLSTKCLVSGSADHQLIESGNERRFEIIYNDCVHHDEPMNGFLTMRWDLADEGDTGEVWSFFFEGVVALPGRELQLQSSSITAPFVQSVYNTNDTWTGSMLFNGNGLRLVFDDGGVYGIHNGRIRFQRIGADSSIRFIEYELTLSQSGYGDTRVARDSDALWNFVDDESTGVYVADLQQADSRLVRSRPEPMRNVSNTVDFTASTVSIVSTTQDQQRVAVERSGVFDSATVLSMPLYSQDGSGQ